MDTYTPMFFCDFLNFMIIIFGFKAFQVQSGSDADSSPVADDDISAVIKDSHVPSSMLFMIFLQFIFILVDRAIYLKKSKIMKLIFQYIMVILIHLASFIIIPYLTRKSFYDNKILIIWYILKCFYLYFSAKQIRGMYPTRVLQNFLTSKFGYVNLFLFMAYRLVPFLWEIQNMMDWMFVDSTLAIGKWIMLNTIYAEIFIVKCWRTIEDEWPLPTNKKKAPIIKYIMGGLMVFLVIAILWFPILFMTLLQVSFYIFIKERRVYFFRPAVSIWEIRSSNKNRLDHSLLV